MKSGVKSPRLPQASRNVIALSDDEWTVLLNTLNDQRHRLWLRFTESAERVAELRAKQYHDTYDAYMLAEAREDLDEFTAQLRRLNDLIARFDPLEVLRG